VQHTALNKSK